MNIIETLFLVFEADTDQLKDALRQIEEGGKKTEESLKGVDLVVHKTKSNFLDFAKTATAALAGMFALKHVFSEILDVSAANAHLSELSKQLGVTAADLGAFADATGGDVGKAGEIFGGLNREMESLAQTGNSRIAPFMHRLGIHMLDLHGHAKKAQDVLPEIAKAFEGMSKQQSTAFGQKLGLDDDTIGLLQLGKKGYEEVIAEQKKLGQMTEADEKAANEFKAAMKDVVHVMKSIYTTLATIVLPILTFFLNVITKTFLFIKDHKAFVVAALVAIGATMIWLKWSAIMGLVSGLLLQAATWAVATAAMWLFDTAAAVAATQAWLLNAAIMAIPLALIALAALLAAVVEDFWVWSHGGESAIGDLVGNFSDFEVWLFDWIDRIAAFFSDTWDGVMKFFTWEGFKEDTLAFGEWLLGWATKLFAKLGEMWTSTKEYFGFGGDEEGEGKTPAPTEKDKTQEVAAKESVEADKQMQEALEKGAVQIGGASATGLNSINGGSIMNSNQQSTKKTDIQIAKIEVTTNATDAEGVAQGLGNALVPHLRQASDHYDDGIGG